MRLRSMRGLGLGGREGGRDEGSEYLLGGGCVCTVGLGIGMMCGWVCWGVSDLHPALISAYVDSYVDHCSIIASYAVKRCCRKP